MQEVQLTPIEARVLGTLMEKRLTTPEQYPLTLNSLVLGCNQKSSREPISNYSSGEVGNCLNQLRSRKLVDVEFGSRAERYDEKLSRVLYLDKREQAALTIMLLRGPQTVGDLINRTQRMAEFSSAEDLEEMLVTLCNKTQPIVMRIAKRSGQREDRFMHLLCGEPDLSALPEAKVISTSNSSNGNAELLARIDELETQLAKVLEHLGLEK